MAGVGLHFDEALLIGQRVLVIAEIDADTNELCQEVWILTFSV